MNPQGLIGALLARKRLVGPPADYKLIQPICSALEVQSYKQALQLCVKQLKKQPDHYVVLTLKALALSLSSRPVSAASKAEILTSLHFICTNKNGQGLGDPDVLMFFAWILDYIGRGAESLKLFELATSKHADNEEVCVEAFLHYVRSGERKSAQQVAMRLQRLHPSKIDSGGPAVGGIASDKKYLWWSLGTVVLQVVDPIAEPSEAKAKNDELLLSLMERMVGAHYRTIMGDQVGEEQKAEIEGLPVAADALTVKEKDDKKGKGKASDVARSTSSTPPLPSSTPSRTTYENAHEFYLLTRFLSLLVEHPPKNPSPTPLVLPSLPSGKAVSPEEALLAHFDSEEGRNWCERQLGMEIWRRETELRYGGKVEGTWEKAAERLRVTLEGGDINWHTMLYLIRLTFASIAGSSASFFPSSTSEPTSTPARPSEDGLTRLSDLRGFFRALAEDAEKGSKERGYLLAVLEISALCRGRGWEGGADLPALVEEYFEKFGTKICCFDDLMNYLEVLSESERVALCEKLVVVIDGSGEMTLSQAQRIINASKVVRYLSQIGTEDVEDKAATKFLTRYFDALPLGKGLPATELQPADDFALLSAQAYVAAWSLSRNRSYLEKALLVLTHAATLSKYKYQLRLLIINLSRLLGACSFSLAHFRILGLKSVQFDTLSHVALSRAATFAVASGNEAGVSEEAQAATKWYILGEGEAGEMPVRSFSFHNYTRIEDFSEFQERLRHSLSKFHLKIETLRIQVLRGSIDPSAAVDVVTFLAAQSQIKTFDNRDFKTLPNLQASSSSTIWDQSQMGPRIGIEWFKAFTAIYSHFLLPAEAVEVECLQSKELTPSEIALLSFSRATRLALSAPLDDVEAEATALSFFKEQESKFTAAVEDVNTLPWELLHVAEVALEGYSLLELAIELRLEELLSTKAPDHMKLSKKLRTFRTSAKDLTRALGTRVNAYAKTVAKQRTKTSAAVASLSEFPAFDEDRITNFAHALTDSRKAMAEGLASAIHRRCSGK